MTAADDIHKYFCQFFSEKIRLDVSSESSARQRIHMKNEALISLKDKSKKLKCHLLQFLFGALRVKTESAKMKICIFANSLDLDETAHNKLPHLDLHYLPSSF